MNSCSSFDRRIILVWIVILAMAFPLLAFLSNHPRLVLRIEESQPSAAYGKGIRLLGEGRREAAVAEFEKGRDFFKRLYGETRSENHKKHWMLCLLAIANTYTDMGDRAHVNQALDYFDQVIQTVPDLSEGQPYLGRGNALFLLGRYKEAADSYSEAIQRGSALLILNTLYRRGYSRLQCNQPEAAADDWYDFLRYYSGTVTQEQWLQFSRQPECANPRFHFVLGNAAAALNDPEKARKHLDAYLHSSPNDRCAKYLYSTVSNLPISSDSGPIPLSECFPPGSAGARDVNILILDLYASRSGTYHLAAGFSGEATGTIVPEVGIVLNYRPIQNLVLVSSAVKEYSIPLELHGGKNILRLEAKKPKATEEQATVILHSLVLYP